MARTITTAMQTAAAGQTLEVALLLEGVFSTGTLRLWTGVGTLSWNGQSWTGGGSVLSVGPPEETAELRAVALDIALGGFNSTLLSAALGSVRSGASGKVWLAVFSGGSIVADPVLIFAGRLDVTEVEEGGDTSTIICRYESRLIDLDRARERRYTDEDQQFEFAGDLGMQYVAALQDQVLPWNQKR